MDIQSPRSAALWQSLIPVVSLIFFLGINIFLFAGSPHIPLVLGTVVACIVGLFLGFSWRQMEESIVQGIMVAIQACLILLVIGMLIGTWILSGIVPFMIYCGLKLLAPSLFLVTTCLICSLISLATGSSWSTVGTVGVALIGVGQGLGIPLPMVAGAIISGSYLGDKISPLSDTTNLAPAVVGTDMFKHIRHMMYTTMPAYVVALLLYALLGLLTAQNRVEGTEIYAIMSALQQNFNLNPLLLLPPLLVILMVLFRIPALPALLGGAVIGGLFALFLQDTSLQQVMTVAQSGFVSTTGIDAVDQLLTRGGMESMLSTVALIICALAFGGAMEGTGMLMAIGGAILRLARSIGTLVLATILTCITMNVIAPDQYLSIVVPGRMYREAFRQRGLAAVNLSRCLEDSGTLSSPLIPWNTCGAYIWATLGIYPFAYLPFAFLNILTPLVSIFYGFTGITIRRLDDNDPESRPV
ncbi:MAG TPA: Na+/H+ antiporter NhaC [bacterium]|jgi:NhaC family Na+:H+ antiporter|nr:Na+/H+ antiporter NhaC [bacterium]HNT64247.1 Na+/H+ antiporter NhaC [bacterium]HOX85237.1 Na+/H+ antiporter NhaC [bacterium]HPG44396.1 Na+/H+ antiporter NhaC [bacterium]HPM96954.1 Na+/H+ antiporter NhaC [bacterium]